MLSQVREIQIAQFAVFAATESSMLDSKSIALNPQASPSMARQGCYSTTQSNWHQLASYLATSPLAYSPTERTEVFKDLATEFVERKSHDSSSLTNQHLVVTSCHACELSTVDRLADSVISRQRL